MPARMNESGRSGMDTGWALGGMGTEWLEEEGLGWRLWINLVAAFMRVLLMDRLGQGKRRLGQKGPRRSLEGRLWELDILPPMAHNALCRPLAALPLMAILALIIAMNVVIP